MMVYSWWPSGQDINCNIPALILSGDPCLHLVLSPRASCLHLYSRLPNKDENAKTMMIKKSKSKLSTLSQQLGIVSHFFLLWIPVAVDEKGLRERRENTSSRFQAFYNALGHENWNSCCLNDEMAHQRDLD